MRRSIFFVIIAFHLGKLCHDLNGQTDHIHDQAQQRENEREQCESLQQIHSIYPVCGSLHLLRALGGTRILQAAAPTATPYFRHWRRSLPLPFAVRHREDLLLQKSSFSGSCLIHSMEWFSELVQDHDHLQCRQHLIAAEAASTAYHKIIRFATKTPPASHLCAAPGACFFCGESPPMSTCTKHCPEVWQAFDRLFSNDIFKNRFKCGIIFVKYATKAERMLRAAEMREKPI